MIFCEILTVNLGAEGDYLPGWTFITGLFLVLLQTTLSWPCVKSCVQGDCSYINKLPLPVAAGCSPIPMFLAPVRVGCLDPEAPSGFIPSCGGPAHP